MTLDTFLQSIATEIQKANHLLREGETQQASNILDAVCDRIARERESVYASGSMSLKEISSGMWEFGIQELHIVRKD